MRLHSPWPQHLIDRVLIRAAIILAGDIGWTFWLFGLAYHHQPTRLWIWLWTIYMLGSPFWFWWSVSIINKEYEKGRDEGRWE